MRMCMVGVWMVLLSVSLWAFPYTVSPDILEEIRVQEALYEQFPTRNRVQFDLAMSYAYSGQILKGWLLLKKLPKPYADVVVDMYEKALERDPNEWRYPFKLAFGYFFQGKKQQAIASFHEVLRVDPKQVWALGFIALVYGEMGEVDETIVYCKKALVIEPNATAVHFLLGEAYRKKKDYYKAFLQVLKVGRLQDSD